MVFLGNVGKIRENLGKIGGKSVCVCINLISDKNKGEQLNHLICRLMMIDRLVSHFKCYVS